MISYIMSVGYNSGRCKDSVWDSLKQEVEKLCDRPVEILEEVLKEIDLSCLGSICDDALEQYAAWYKNCKDETIFIIDDKNERSITQYASGYGESRKIKELFRRAFIRLIMKRMHKLNMDINVHVQ